MRHLRSATLLEGDAARVTDVACTAPRSGAGAAEWSGRPQVIVPRRGVFCVHRGGEELVLDPTAAVVLGAGDEYRVSHPVAGGDRCLSLTLEHGLAEEALGDVRGAVRLTARAQLAAALLAPALRDADALEGEETALLALAAVAGRPRRTAPARVGNRRVADVRALLAADPARTWRLAEIGRAVHTSPYHLARQFRAATGDSIGAHLLRLRLALALERLADGDADLARIGLDAGFAHHSHFTARFRATFGITPARARGARARELRTILTVPRAVRA